MAKKPPSINDFLPTGSTASGPGSTSPGPHGSSDSGTDGFKLGDQPTIFAREPTPPPPPAVNSGPYMPTPSDSSPNLGGPIQPDEYKPIIPTSGDSSINMNRPPDHYSFIDPQSPHPPGPVRPTKPAPRMPGRDPKVANPAYTHDMPEDFEPHTYPPNEDSVPLGGDYDWWNDLPPLKDLSPKERPGFTFDTDPESALWELGPIPSPLRPEPGSPTEVFPPLAFEPVDPPTIVIPNLANGPTVNIGPDGSTYFQHPPVKPPEIEPFPKFPPKFQPGEFPPAAPRTNPLTVPGKLPLPSTTPLSHEFGGFVVENAGPLFILGDVFGGIFLNYFINPWHPRPLPPEDRMPGLPLPPTVSGFFFDWIINGIDPESNPGWTGGAGTIPGKTVGGLFNIPDNLPPVIGGPPEPNPIRPGIPAVYDPDFPGIRIIGPGGSHGGGLGGPVGGGG